MSRTSNWSSYISGVFDRAADTYDGMGIDFFGPAGVALVDGAELRPADSVLDIGCGRGASLVPAAQAVGADGSAIGIDISPVMVAHANARLAAMGLTHADARVGDASDPDFAPRSYDAILAGFVIFFLQDPDEAIRRYAKLLRPGGRLAMTVKPEDIPAHAVVKSGVDKALEEYLPANAEPARSATLSSRELLTQLLHECGFARVTYVDTAFPVVFDGPEHYWDWMWSHGMRGTLERIPEGRVGSARAAVVDALVPHLDASGRLPCPMPARFVVAHLSEPVDPVGVHH